MDAYKGKGRRIKDALITVLQQVQLNGEPAFTSVMGNATGNLDGYPSVRVLPADVSNQRPTAASAERSVNFSTFVHVPLEDTSITEEAAYNAVYDLTDLIIDQIDTGDFVGALNVVDPTIGTYLMTADRGDWSVIDGQGGPVLVCEVTISVRYSKAL